MIGREIGHFTIVEKLGGGGMGVVYKARDTLLDRFVALKFLPPHLNDDPTARERFIREAKAASGLEQSNVCTVHEIGETDDGQLFIAMTFYDGEPLGRRLGRGPLPVGEAVSIARDVARGLAGAHRAGIIHRDVKPANIMITAQGEVRILDFGLAALGVGSKLTRSGSTVGTVPFMSPEQVRGETLDARSDLWSLGVVLYEMLTGRSPFEGSSEFIVFHSILDHDPKPPSAFRPEIPPNLDRVVMGLLAKARNDRCATAEQFLEQLDGIWSGLDSVSETVALRPAVLPASRKGMLSLAAGAIALAAALGAVVLAGRVGGGSWHERYRNLAVMPFANYTGDAALDALCDGIGSGLITRLSEVGGLQVVGRSEAWRFRDAKLGADQLGDRLGVGIVLEGSVARSTGGLAVTANLVDTLGGHVLWSDELRGSQDDVLTLQQHIAGRLMRVLTIGLSPRERERLAKDPTQSFRAYREYLEAQRTIEASGDEGGAEPAIALYREAIRVDPGFALAYAGLSEALWLKGASEGKPEAMVEAEEAARKALELDPELPAAKVALARTRRHKGEYGASIAELKTVLADHPHPDEAQRELAYSYERAGDLEAAENALRAAVAVGGDNWLNWNELGSFLWEAGRYGEAKAAFVKAAALSPEGVTKAEENVAAVEVSQGHFDQAVRTYEQIAQPIRSAILASNIGTAYYFSDRPDKWRQAERYYSLAVRLNPRDDRIQRNLADLFAHLGRIHEASEHYRDALSVIEAKLQGDPANTDLRLRRALYAAKAGNCGEAVGWAEELGRQLPDTAENALHLAQIYGTCGERSGALRWIGKAAELGVPPKLLEEQDEFDSLRDDPAFTKLVSRRSEGRAGAPPP